MLSELVEAYAVIEVGKNGEVIIEQFVAWRICFDGLDGGFVLLVKIAK